MTADIWKNTMNIPQISPKQSSLPTAMAWCITNRFCFLLTPNIRRSLYLLSKDSRLLEKFWTKKMGGGDFRGYDQACSGFDASAWYESVCVGKEMQNIVFHDSNHCSSGRPVERRDDWKNLSGFGNHTKRLLRFLIFVVKSRSPCWKPAQWAALILLLFYPWAISR